MDKIIRWVYAMKFEWDCHKNQLNIQKHGLDFKDAKELFLNDSLWSVQDDRVGYSEIRLLGFGRAKGRLVNIVYTKRSPNAIRIISFRKANQREVKAYERNFQN